MNFSLLLLFKILYEGDLEIDKIHTHGKEIS